MNFAAPDGDTIVALLGVVMAMILVSRSSRLRGMPGRKRLILGAIWAVIFGLVAGISALLSRGSP
jgi:uncharacterized YccA/Bax inhibitor family protein